MAKASVALHGLEAEGTAEQISDLYETWHSSRQGHLRELKEIVEYVYATDTSKTSNRKNPWSHKTHIPKLTQVHDNLGTQYANALVGRDDFFTFSPGNPESSTKAKRKAAVAYLLTKHKYSKFKLVVKQLLNDWVQTGEAVAQLQYVVETGKDHLTGQLVTLYQGPKLVRISPYDIEFDHTAASFAEAPKVVRQLITLGGFCREVEECVELGYDPWAVQKVKDLRSAAMPMKQDELAKISQRQLDGFSDYGAYMRSGKVELLHFYGDLYDLATGVLMKDRMITVVDRRYVLRNACASDFGNIGQLYYSTWRKRPDNLRGQSPLANLLGMQYLMNHLENTRADAFDQAVEPDEVFVGQVETVEPDGTGGRRQHFIDDGNGSVTYLRPDATFLQADLQIQYKEAQIEAYAGAPREAMGIRTPGEKTAFEFSELADAASKLFQNKIEDFQEEMLDPILNGELELAQRNLSSDILEMEDEDFGVTEFRAITKEDLIVRGKIVPEGASHFARRSQAVRELQQFSTVLAQDQGLAIHFPAKARAQAWNELMDMDRFKLYQEFGGVAEQVEMAQIQQAAQQMIQQNQAGGEVAQDVKQGVI